MPEIQVQKAGVSGLPLHAPSHEPGGDDELTALTEAAFAAAYKDGAAGVPTLRSLGTAAGQALPGDHASVTNARAPIAHKASHEPGGSDALTGLTDDSFAAANKDGVTAEPSLRTLGTGAQQAAAGDHLHDTRYIRTVNGTGPDSGGNVVVTGGSGGTSGVGSIEGVSPNAPGGNVDLTSSDGSVTITPDNTLDTVDLKAPGAAVVQGNLDTHTAKTVDPTSTNATRDKHVANADLNGLRDIPLPPHHFKGTLAVVTGVGKLPMMRDGTLVSVRAQVGTAPAGAPVTLSIRKGGTQITTVTIAAGAVEGTATIAVAVTAGESLTVNITAVGSTTAGADLTVGYTLRAI